jgi:hypothetical protein
MLEISDWAFYGGEIASEVPCGWSDFINYNNSLSLYLTF